METNESEPSMTCRKTQDDVEIGAVRRPRDEDRDEPVECSVGVRHRGGVNVDWALVRNVRTCRPDVKGEAQVGSPGKRQSTDAGHRGRSVRSRAEGSVMELDRRGAGGSA